MEGCFVRLAGVKGLKLMFVKAPICVCILTLWLVQGCTLTPQKPLTERNSDLTQGNVQLNLKVGKTTKADVLAKFGSPNITTRNRAGREVWTYQRSAQVSQASSQANGWNVILFGSQSGRSGFESGSRMVTLIIKFNSKDVVVDFNSRTSNF